MNRKIVKIICFVLAGIMLLSVILIGVQVLLK